MEKELSKDAKNANSANLTAVKWLAEQYEKLLGKAVTTIMSDEIQQAKEMEKEQHENTWDDSFLFKDDWEMKFEQYYNETYGGGK